MAAKGKVSGESGMNWWRFGKGGEQTGRAEALQRYDRCAQAALQLAGTGGLGLEDDFNLRFELMILFASQALHRMRLASGQPDSPAAQALWEMVFEGFDHSLRQRGVVDLRMAGRMRKLLLHATGRRNAYLAAWEAGDEGLLREAIARNVLNLAPADDARVAVVLAALAAESRD